MAQPAGSTYTIFKPRIYIAPLGTVLPAINLAFGADWPAGWVRVKYTEEGAMITPTAPKEDIEADEGLLGLVPEGTDQINISWTTKTPDMDLVSYLSNFGKQSVAAQTGVDPEPSYPAYDRYSLNKEGTPFMVGIEGTFSEGALTAEGGLVRAFGYKVEQTEEVELQFRARGADAVLSPAANVRCLPAFVSAEQLEGTGISEVDERFDMFVVSNAA